MSSKRTKRKGGPFSHKEQTQVILKWAVTEMRLNPDTVPSMEDLNTLLRETTGNPWEYICEHIHSSATVDNVRQNLSFHSEATATQHMYLLMEKNELQTDLFSLQAAISQTIEDTSRLEEEIASLESECQLCQSEMEEISNKSTLLSAHSLSCTEVVSVLREYSKRIRQQKELFSYPEKETKYFTRELSTQSTAVVGLETACMRDVRSVCTVVEEMLQSSDSRAKEQAWSRTESLLSMHHPHEIVCSLTQLTTELAHGIRSHTENIDLARDAKELRYQGGDDGEGDLLQSVGDHLCSAQLDHVTRALEAKSVRKDAESAKQHLDEVKGQLGTYLSTMYTHDELRNLIRTKVWLELDLSGLEAGLAVLSHCVSQLQSSQTEKREALEALSKKKRRVEELSCTIEQNQTGIQTLVKHNSLLHDRLTQQCTELSLYRCDNVSGMEALLVGATTLLLNSIALEIQPLSTVSLIRVMKAPGASSPWCEQSIRCLHPHQPTGSLCWALMLPLLGLSRVIAPEAILDSLVDSLRRVKLSASEAKRVKEVDDVMKMSAVSKHTQDVEASCYAFDQQLHTEGLSAVRQYLSQAAQGLSQCSHVEHTLKEWWDQPAQDGVPWVCYDGMSCDKWVEQWRVLAAKLRQLASPQIMSC